MSFDIPSQPLPSALDSYVTASGLEVFYVSSLAAGRMSTAVSGQISRDVALSILLEGTGLTAVNVSNAFSIEPVPAVASRGPSVSSHLPYFALVQSAIEEAFCRSPQTAPGGYRLGLRFRIGTAGKVMQAEVIGTTGNAERDKVIAAVLGGLNIGRAPPHGMPQPVTMLISPRPPIQTGDCRPGGGQRSQRVAP